MDCKPEELGDETLEQGTGAAAAAAMSSSALSASSRVDSQLQDAVRLKTEGNAFYRAKNIRSAIGHYHRSLLILRSLDSEVTATVKGFGAEVPVLTAGQEELLRDTQVDCYNNLSACLLLRQTVDYGRVQEYSLRVLERRPGNVKAMYRAGVAFLEQGDAQTARNFLSEASKGQPNDANVRRHLQRAVERLGTEKERERALYRGMFPGPAGDSHGAGGGGASGVATGVTQEQA